MVSKNEKFTGNSGRAREDEEARKEGKERERVILDELKANRKVHSEKHHKRF